VRIRFVSENDQFHVGYHSHEAQLAEAQMMQAHQTYNPPITMYVD
jgi:hypothetical protein